MSLRSTIDAAREEAKEVAADRSVPKEKADDKKASAKTEYDPMNLGKRTAANAKPVSEAGASVRTSSGSSKASLATMSKEQKKAEKQRRREEEDLRTRAYDIVLRANPDYKKTDRMWWVLLGIGFAMTILSLVMAYAFPAEANSTDSTQGILAVVSLVLAYVFIIGAFVYDLVKRRPFRKAAERKVQGMTDKKLAELFEAERQRRIADEAAREAKKAAKK